MTPKNPNLTTRSKGATTIPLQIPSYIQRTDGLDPAEAKKIVDLYRVLLDIARFVNSLEISFRELNNHIVKDGGDKQDLSLTPTLLQLIERSLESTGKTPLNVDGLPGQLLDPQGAGIPTANVLPDITTVGPGQAYFVGGILYIANNTVNPPVWSAITSSTSPQANHFVLIGPVSGGPLTPTYRALALSDLPALSGVTITSPTIATGIAADGSGLKHQSFSTGSIPLSTQVDVVCTWATAFANTSYTPVFAIEDSSNRLRPIGIKSFTAADVTITVLNTDAGGAHAGTLHLIAAHN